MATFLSGDVTVYTRATWAGAWVEQPAVVPVSALDCAAPGVPVAKLYYDYGRIRRRGATEHAVETPLSIADHYIKIVPPSPHKPWYGVVTSVASVHLGAGVAAAAGRQEIQAHGLAHLLGQSYVLGAYVEDDGALGWVGTCPAFNQRHAVGGTLLGNRAAAQLSGKWCFATNGATWNYSQAVEYLLSAYAPPTVPWAIVGLDDFDEPELDDGGVPLVYAPEGRKVADILNDLIDRRRGYAWTIRVSTDETAVNVTAFSLLSAAVVSEVTFSANAEPVALDIHDDLTVDRAVTRDNRARLCDTVRVVGANVKSCFTVAIGDGTLTSAWKAEEQQAYADGAKNADGYAAALPSEQAALNKTFRGDARFTRVFSRFRVPAAFSWYSSQAGLEEAINVSPSITVDGEVSVSPGNSWTGHKAIMQLLPLLAGVDYATEGHPDANPTGAEPEFLPPLVFIKNGAGRYVLANAIDDEHMAPPRVTVLEREMALDIAFTPRHLLASTVWEACTPEPSAVEPAFGWLDLAVTLCMTTDEKLMVTESVAATAEWRNPKTIFVPDAELWLVAENTVVGVGDDGALKRLYGDQLAIRDDSPRLRAIAALAKQWYCTERRAVDLVYSTLDSPCEVGNMITTLTVGDGTAGVDQTVTCNSVVTRKTWEFENARTEICTEWWDVDFHRIVPNNMPGANSTASLNRALFNSVTAQYKLASGGL